MKKENGSKLDKKGNILEEIENLEELIDRERASMSVMLSAASAGYDQIENDTIVMFTRDSLDRIEKMGTFLSRIESAMR